MFGKVFITYFNFYHIGTGSSLCSPREAIRESNDITIQQQQQNLRIGLAFTKQGCNGCWHTPPLIAVCTVVGS